MFDIMTYAANNALTITTTPLIETDEITGLKKIGSWHIIISNNFGRCERIIDPCSKDFEKELDSMLAEIGRKKAGQISAKQVSRQLAEREKFFRCE